jgi:hypothetical protein
MIVRIATEGQHRLADVSLAEAIREFSTEDLIPS